jgi:hypothetical protein
MNVEIGIEAAQFLEKEYVTVFSMQCTVFHIFNYIIFSLDRVKKMASPVRVWQPKGLSLQ